MEGVRPELARIRGLRIFAAFLYSGDVEHIDRLIRELQDRTNGAKLLYLTTSATPLRVVPDSTSRPVSRSIMDEPNGTRDWPG